MDNLFEAASRIKNIIDKKVIIQTAQINNVKVYRLMVGSFSTREEAEIAKSNLVSYFPGSFTLELD